MNSNKIEALKQRIYHLTELRKLIITGIIILTGGLASLFLNINDWRGIVIFILGINLFIILFILNKSLAIDVEKTIRNLETEA
jgi:hypothetical protein